MLQVRGRKCRLNVGGRLRVVGPAFEVQWNDGRVYEGSGSLDAFRGVSVR